MSMETLKERLMWKTVGVVEDAEEPWEDSFVVFKQHRLTGAYEAFELERLYE